MRYLCGVLVLLALASPAFAQRQIAKSTSSLTWNYGEGDATSWKLAFDGGPAIDVTPQALPPGHPWATAGTTTWMVLLPTLSIGDHTVVVSACNEAGCLVSDPLDFSRMDPPKGVISGVQIRSSD